MAGAQVQAGGGMVKVEEDNDDMEEFDPLFDSTEVKSERRDSVSSSDELTGVVESRKRPAEEALEPNMTKLSTPVWALKIPKWLADRWAELEEEDVDLGEVRFHAPIDGVTKTDASLILSDTAVNNGLPKEYKLTVLETSRKSLYAFSEREDGTVDINGTIGTECDAHPVMCEELRQILEKRDQEQATNKAPILLTNEEMKPNAIVPGVQTLSLPLARKPPTKQQILESKTARMPKNELLDLLFSAFEKYQLWTFKGILEYVRQPMSYTREVLQEVAVLHKKGEHTGKYELKPEFRRGGAGAVSALSANEEMANDGGEEEFSVESGEEGEEGIDDDAESAEEDEFEEVE